MYYQSIDFIVKIENYNMRNFNNTYTMNITRKKIKYII